MFGIRKVYFILKKTIMTLKFKSLFILFILTFSLFQTTCDAQSIESYKQISADKTLENAVKNENNYNGYTNYWHDSYNNLYRYGNLFKMAVPNVEKTILQSKVDIAEDMGISGLAMQEGFVYNLISSKYVSLTEPSVEELESNLKKGNVLVFVDPGSALGRKVNARLSFVIPLF